MLILRVWWLLIFPEGQAVLGGRGGGNPRCVDCYSQQCWRRLDLIWIALCELTCISRALRTSTPWDDAYQEFFEHGHYPARDHHGVPATISREPCGDNLHGKAFIKGDRSTFRFWRFVQHNQAGTDRNLAEPLLTFDASSSGSLALVSLSPTCHNPMP